MPTDPRNLKPGDLVLLLNSTPLGEVIDLAELRRHRQKAGLRLGDNGRVDLLKYTAWLVGQRHATSGERNNLDLTDTAAGGAAVANAGKATLTPRHEAAITALLTESSHRAAAAKVGVVPSTLYRWLKETQFRSAYRRARKELVESAIGRLQAATGQAVDTLVAVARRGRRDGDRVRAAAIVLDQSIKAVHEADPLHGDEGGEGNLLPASTGTKDLVQMLANRLHQVDRADLPTAEKVRLTASLADTLLRAIGVDVLDARLEALQAVLGGRKEALR